jgi:hypothetical protein
VAIHEAVGVERGAQPGRLLVQLIKAGWNTSKTRYYPAAMLERDAHVARRGTLNFVDHATESQDAERPEGSLKDLASVQVTDAYWDPGRQALMAEVRLFAPWREAILDMADHIGMSIRADGMGEVGEAEGYTGLIVNSLTTMHSVDYVTRPGAGGGIVAVLESDRASLKEAATLGGWLESRLHLALTQYADDMYGDGRLTRDERITLSGAIGDALQVWTARVEQDAPQLFTRDLYSDPEPTSAAVAESDTTPPPEPDPTPVVEPEAPPPDPVPAVPATDVTDGAEPAAPTNPTESEDPMSGTQTGTPPVTAGTATAAEAPTISAEARVEIAAAQLAEAQSRITALESQNATLTSERDAANGELRRMRNVEAARGVCTSALATHTDLADPTRNRITEAVTRDVPTTATGEVDTTALTAAIGRHVESERTYIASIREAAGEGTPTGLGNSTPTNTADLGAFQGAVANRLQGFGLSEAAAKSAAVGRV